jgi:hypothetical protein
VTTASQVFADDGQQKFRYAVGSFGAEPRHRVANGRAREALDQIVLVVVEVYTRDRFQGGCGLAVYVGKQEPGEQRVLA